MEDNVRFATCPAQVSGTVKPWKVPFMQALDFKIGGGDREPPMQKKQKQMQKRIKNWDLNELSVLEERL